MHLTLEEIMRTFTIFAVIAAAALLTGCGTINSYANGCPAPYSGVRTDHEYLSDVGPFPGDGLRWLMVTGDLPLSAVVDTLTLPIGAWARRPPPTPVVPGCHWAIPQR